MNTFQQSELKSHYVDNTNDANDMNDTNTELPINISLNKTSEINSNQITTMNPQLTNSQSINLRSMNLQSTDINEKQTDSKDIPEILRPSIPESKAQILKRVTTRGLSGLSNMGNTCYMNAALQALSATKPLLAYLIHPKSELQNHIENRLLDDKYIKHEKEMEKTGLENDLEVTSSDITAEAKATSTYKLRIMFKYMWARNCEVRPMRFKKAVDSQLTFFGGMMQHDSQEFLTALLDKIHEDTKANGNTKKTNDEHVKKMETEIKGLDKDLIEAKKVKNKVLACTILDKLNILDKYNTALYLKVRSIMAWETILEQSYSVINDIFSGLSLTTITCEDCKKATYKFERFDIMTLHLPEEVDLSKSKYTLHELLTDYVGIEEMRDANKYRCTYCVKKTNAVKKNVLYQQPNVLVLMIKKYQKYQGKIIKSNIKIEYEHELDITPFVSEHTVGNNKYELYAAIRHSGGYGGGHYYSYTKSPINGRWFLCDDGDIYHVDDGEVLNANGYVLFYRQK